MMTNGDNEGMMTLRSLIKEIPSGKFHSAVMTAFSINLFYWESQLLRTLSGKGINFVSGIVDVDCLSEQFQKFSQTFGERRRTEYSLHGYRSKGAFHPKIQFYVGNHVVLVLVGSGNLTLSGHGGNMEVWTPVYVDSRQNPAYPFMREVWNYLKSLYSNLGNEANNVVRALEQNCVLLQEDFTAKGLEYSLNEETSIKLFADGSRTLFAQCQEWTGPDEVNTITILSPFYDSNALFIKALHEEYHPKEINIIVEKDFGTPPESSKIPDYVNIYLWDEIGKDGNYQKYFHAKCIFFEGNKFHYLICGSANASVAAFGTTSAGSANHEMCVGFKSSTTDYFKNTGFVLRRKADASELVRSGADNKNEAKLPPKIWIKEASYDGINFYVELQSTEEINDATIWFFTGYGQMAEIKNRHIVAGESKLESHSASVSNPLYVEIRDNNGSVVSNRQFMISTISMEMNDPSPENVSYRRRCHEIESGLFIDGQLLQFLEHVILNTESKTTKCKSESKPTDKPAESKEVREFETFDDYIKDDGNGITGGIKERSSDRSSLRSTMLLDSIMRYISKSAADKAEERINNEETEDIKHSKGKAKNNGTGTPELTLRNAIDVRKRVIAMFEKYLTNLPDSVKPSKKKINGKEKLVKPDFHEVLKRFMTTVFFLSRVFGHRFKTEKESAEKLPLFDLPFNKHSRQTATEYFYRTIANFAFHVMKGDFEEDHNAVIANQKERDKQYAFDLSLAVASVCDWINEGNEDYEEISNFCKLPALKNLQKTLGATVDHQTQNRIMRLFDKSIQELDGFDISHLEAIVADNVQHLTNAHHLTGSDNLSADSLLWTNEFGYVSLEQRPDKPNMAYPHTMLSNYDKKRNVFIPDYIYLFDRKRLHPKLPKSASHKKC